MTTNVFLTAYEQPENKLTYAFLCLIEHLDGSTLEKILSRLHVPVDKVRAHSVKTIYGGGQTNPDGSIHLNSGADNGLTVYLENKTWRRPLEIDQIRGHIREHLGTSENLLLVITSDQRDEHLLKSLKESRLRFVTWNEIIESLHGLPTAPLNQKDSFLLSQFVDYVEESGEGWRAKMIERNLIEAVRKSIEIEDDVEKFKTHSLKLLRSFVEEPRVEDRIYAGFEEHVRFERVFDGEGLYALSFRPTKAELEPWLFLGIYHNQRSHKIPFKKPFEPEYLILLGLKRQNREKVLAFPGIKETIGDLQKVDFELNIPEQHLESPWPVCYWHEPMLNFLKKDVGDLKDILRGHLSDLLSSTFYRKFEAANSQVQGAST